MKLRTNRPPQIKPYLTVPVRMKATPRKNAEKVTVFKHGQFPIGDLYHARLALIYVLPEQIKDDLTSYVIGAVQETWPMYKWNLWWNKRRKGSKSTWGTYINRYKKLEGKKKMIKNSSLALSKLMCSHQDPNIIQALDIMVTLSGYYDGNYSIEKVPKNGGGTIKLPIVQFDTVNNAKGFAKYVNTAKVTKGINASLISPQTKSSGNVKVYSDWIYSTVSPTTLKRFGSTAVLVECGHTKAQSKKSKINPLEKTLKRNSKKNSPFHQYMSIAKLKGMRKTEANAKKLGYRKFELKRKIADEISKGKKVTAYQKKKHPRVFGELERIEAWLKDFHASKKTKKKAPTKRKKAVVKRTISKRKTTAKKKTTSAKKKATGKLTLKEIETKARSYNRGSKVGKYQKLVAKHGKMNAKRILSKAKKLQK